MSGIRDRPLLHTRLTGAALDLFIALEPHLELSGLVCRLDMHDAWMTTHNAVFDVGLSFAASEVNGKLIHFATEGAYDYSPSSSGGRS
ncbi:MAG TPA: hypothetical protein VKP30_28210 [Polyangiaceae bacterium]|nr:hypothetical protein [Polyangiaceae bacterium]